MASKQIALTYNTMVEFGFQPAPNMSSCSTYEVS